MCSHDYLSILKKLRQIFPGLPLLFCIWTCMGTGGKQDLPEYTLNITHLSELAKLSQSDKKGRATHVRLSYMELDEKSLAPLAEFTVLRELEIHDAKLSGKLFTNIGPSLQTLRLSKVIFKNRDAWLSAANFKGLLRLEIEGGYGADDFSLAPFCEIKTLTSIAATNVHTRASDPLAPLKNCGHLKELSFAFQGGTFNADVRVLAGLRNLVVLRDGNGFLNDGTMNTISGLTSLKLLRVGNTIGDASIPALLKLKGLQALDLKWDQISDEGFSRLFTGLRELEEVSLWSSKITNTGVKHLSTLPGLKSFSCIACRGIDDGVYESLRTVQTLRYVELAHSGASYDVVKKLKAELPSMR